MYYWPYYPYGYSQGYPQQCGTCGGCCCAACYAAEHGTSHHRSSRRDLIQFSDYAEGEPIKRERGELEYSSPSRRNHRRERKMENRAPPRRPEKSDGYTFEDYQRDRKQFQKSEAFDFSKYKPEEELTVRSRGGAIRIWDRKTAGIVSEPRRVVVQDDFNEFDKSSSFFFMDSNQETVETEPQTSDDRQTSENNDPKRKKSRSKKLKEVVEDIEEFEESNERQVSEKNSKRKKSRSKSNLVEENEKEDSADPYEDQDLIYDLVTKRVSSLTQYDDRPLTEPKFHNNHRAEALPTNSHWECFFDSIGYSPFFYLFPTRKHKKFDIKRESQVKRLVDFIKVFLSEFQVTSGAVLSIPLDGYLPNPEEYADLVTVHSLLKLRPRDYVHIWNCVSRDYVSSGPLKIKNKEKFLSKFEKMKVSQFEPNFSTQEIKKVVRLYEEFKFHLKPLFSYQDDETRTSWEIFFHPDNAWIGFVGDSKDKSFDPIQAITICDNFLDRFVSKGGAQVNIAFGHVEDPFFKDLKIRFWLETPLKYFCELNPSIDHFMKNFI